MLALLHVLSNCNTSKEQVAVHTFRLQKDHGLCWSTAGKRGAPADRAAAEPAAWELDFNIWRPTSPLYRGTDTELTMKLTTFWFFCNRPTVGALIGLGSDLAAATAVAKLGDVPGPAEQPPADEQSTPQEPVSSAMNTAAPTS